jgi:hypothetical protein
MPPRDVPLKERQFAPKQAYQFVVGKMLVHFREEPP